MQLGRWQQAGLAASVLALGLFLFGDLAAVPPQQWDESRLAVNAAEMAISGEKLITTYNFQPDLWNTKPSLMIMLMAGSLELFGFNTLGLRVPSALAAFTTVLLLFWFVRRVTGSAATAYGAALLTAASSAFYGFHAGRNGDYDAVLTLLSTAYGFALFSLLDSDRRRYGLAVVTGVLVGLAVLIKDVAGLIPGIGIALYALLFARVRLITAWREWVIVAALVVALTAAFYLPRALGDPHYVAAVIYNELGGRFGNVQDQHGGSWRFYLAHLTQPSVGETWPMFAGGAALYLGVLAPWVLADRPRRLAVFCLCQAGALLVVFSSAATKLQWYAEPAVPFLSIALALAALSLWRWLAARAGMKWLSVFGALIVAALTVAGGQAVLARYVRHEQQQNPPRRFAELIAAAVDAGALPLAVYDRGVGNNAGFVNYTPTLRFAILGASRDGHRVMQVSSPAEAQAARFIGSCDPATYAETARLGQRVWEADGCILVRR